MVASDGVISQYLLWLYLVEKQCCKIGYTTDSFGDYSFSEDFVLGRNEHEAVHNAMEFWNTAMRSRLATA